MEARKASAPCMEARREAIPLHSKDFGPEAKETPWYGCCDGRIGLHRRGRLPAFGQRLRRFRPRCRLPYIRSGFDACWCRRTKSMARSGRRASSTKTPLRTRRANADRSSCAGMVRNLYPAPARSLTELITFVTDRPGHDRQYAIDRQRWTPSFSGRPKIPFGEGLETTAIWYIDNPDWCGQLRGGYRGERLGLG